MSALPFLCEHGPEQPLNQIEEGVRARQLKRQPAVLTVDMEEVSRVMAHRSGDKCQIAMPQPGGNLRLLNVPRLRVKDHDFQHCEITVREGKGDKDQVTMLPQEVDRPLQEHFRRVKAIHELVLADGFNRVELPHALGRKYPNAKREWRWQFVFPQKRCCCNPQTGEQGRHYFDESLDPRSVKSAIRQARIAKRGTSHTFEHSMATCLVADGCDIRTVQELHGYKNVRTTIIFRHFLKELGG